jgi:hypothetical protein
VHYTVVICEPTYNERPAECVIAHDLVPPVQLAREAAEQRDQHGHRREHLQRIAAEILVRSHESIDHEEDQGDENGHEELHGAATVEEDDPAWRGSYHDRFVIMICHD